jgi:hypothetical protein
MKNTTAWFGSALGLPLSFISASAFSHLLWENWIKFWIYYGGRDTHYYDGAPDLGRGIGMAILGGVGITSGIIALILAYVTIHSPDRFFKVMRYSIYTLGGIGVFPPLLIWIILIAVDWSQPLWR